jgi:hypothetical protein
MYTDAQLRFSVAQTVTTGSENGVYSTNVIDLGGARDIGAGENIYAVVDVITATTGAGDTCLVQVVTDDNADLNSPTVTQTIGQFGANSAAGSRIIARLSPVTLERYIAIKYTANGDGALETGAFSAYLVSEVDYQRYYAKGSLIE